VGQWGNITVRLHEKIVIPRMRRDADQLTIGEVAHILCFEGLPLVAKAGRAQIRPEEHGCIRMAGEIGFENAGIGFGE
jgi:hypothetical protein